MPTTQEMIEYYKQCYEGLSILQKNVVAVFMEHNGSVEEMAKAAGMSIGSLSCRMAVIYDRFGISCEDPTRKKNGSRSAVVKLTKALAQVLDY